MKTDYKYIVLPKKLTEMNGIFVRIAKTTYEQMGIRILSELDAIFYKVRLPKGWYIKATDNDTHISLLIDDHDVVRGRIRYEYGEFNVVKSAIFVLDNERR